MKKIKKIDSILEKVNQPADIKNLDIDQLNQLSGELREFIIDLVSKTGGHLASNLGVIELTLALHMVFSSPEDKFVWDVGHQTYIHKILTGRKELFSTLRQLGGLSGFPKSKESEHDIFNTGHSSTSISAALGLAKARDLKNEHHNVVAVIGDGALTGGMAFEALNDAGRSPNNLIVILNDNEMSITKNVGGLSTYLNRIRTEPVYFKVKEDIDFILNKIPAIGKSMAKTVQRAKGSIKYMIVPGTLFEELGFTYVGPIDGHNISNLMGVLNRAKNMKGPILIHVYTTKGKGYSFAEEEPDIFHGVSSFNIETGKALGAKTEKDYSAVFGDEMVRIGKKDKTVTAVSAAMPVGTGLGNFIKEFPDRFFDVGIAEQHAVTFAAGLAVSNLKPVFAVYSSFLQRAYDQILHDVALQNLHVVFAVDRAGVVGQDGETHQGIYDLSFLSHIPNMVVMAPSCYEELNLMMEYAVVKHDGPIAVRYPRGKEEYPIVIHNKAILPGKGEKLSEGKDISLIAIGKMVGIALEAAEKLKKAGIDAEVINARCCKPLDADMIINSALKTGKVITLEDNSVIGGFGSAVLSLLQKNKCGHVKVKLKGWPDEIIPHGSVNELFKIYELDADSLVKEALKMM
ncbi:1-deoxy-D-xylulose-5-phosphate synthase [Petroclostridium sp. X23]|uniref:1-deoxy-D-xylulose-5-phosphate synthase n=1 Tax=Petroclostridium sp. X23 TaxID=3045146 RepID=UPI0024AE4CAE|nr:1-deoxy-D-xylulose-5-phosphate synthase [Petroclostridium sp. X23]WHH59633.1 1-deoxy-D-xylulose-5-phosphate synthase [Petroclostridium sp. X23]